MNEPNLISGIHNYCDRWCERCAFTERCAVFQEEKASGFDAANATMEESLEYVSQQFSKTLNMVYEHAESMGIDLDNLPDVPEETGTPLDPEFLEKAETLNKKSMDYAKVASVWFEANEPLIKKKEKELNNLQQLGIEQQSNARQLKDAFEVISWYMFFIAAKTRRATNIDDQEDMNFPDPIQNDHHGSAKIGLIAIEKSMKAWQTILKHIEEATDEVIDILGSLESMKKDLLELFPKVNEFVRPGFDE